jgi:hypothetical protein
VSVANLAEFLGLKIRMYSISSNRTASLPAYSSALHSTPIQSPTLKGNVNESGFRIQRCNK